MTFSLHVDGARWRRHLRTVVTAGTDADTAPAAYEVAPVIKGNGYGFGPARLSLEAQALGVDTVCVGTVFEVGAVADSFTGDILVLTPYDTRDTAAAGAWRRCARDGLTPRLIRTVADPDALHDCAVESTAEPLRIVVDGLTSMRRFGFDAATVTAALRLPALTDALGSGRVHLVGLALHLPLVQPPDTGGSLWREVADEPAWPAAATPRVREVVRWARQWQQLLGDLQQQGGQEPAVVEALTSAATLWLSHLGRAELAVLHELLPGTPLALRLGTSLWLGDRGAMKALGTVLAVHEERKGERAGYRQRRAPRDDTLVVVGGGTAHGVALEAPTPAATVRQRATAAGTGVLEAGGRSLSPFTIGGKQRWFAEPPHMQVSMIRLPEGTPIPPVGAELACDVRMTTATFDAVIGLD